MGFRLSLDVGLGAAINQGGGVLSALSLIKSKLAAGQSVDLLTLADSIWYGHDNAAYLFAQWLGTQYPSHTVLWREWAEWVTSAPTGPQEWKVAETVSTGTGAETITVWNGSLPGSTPNWLAGERLAPLMANPADLIMMYQGQNLMTQAGLNTQLLKPAFYSAIGQIQVAKPASPLVVFVEHPRLADTKMDFAETALAEIAADYGGFTVVNANAVFKAAGKPSAWWNADGIHLEALGDQALRDVMISAWRGAIALADFVPGLPWPGILAAANIFANGNFENWTGLLPASWSQAGASAVATKETTIKETGSWSLALTATSAVHGISQQIDARPYAGQRLSIYTRRCIPKAIEAALLTSCIPSMNIQNASAVTILTPAFPGGQGAVGGYIWSGFEVDVPATARFLTFALQRSSSGAPSTDPVYIDRVIGVANPVPRGSAA